MDELFGSPNPLPPPAPFPTTSFQADPFELRQISPPFAILNVPA